MERWISDTPHMSRVQSPPPPPDSKVHGANMGPNWGRQDPGRPHVDPMNFVIWDAIKYRLILGSCLSHCSRKGVRLIKKVVESIKISC